MLGRAPTAFPTLAAAAKRLNKAQRDFTSQLGFYRIVACRAVDSTEMARQHGATTDAMKISSDQIKATWSSLGSERIKLGLACKTANDEFAGLAAELGY